MLSPAVVATWIAHQDQTGIAQLDLLVLWRGSLGWFMQSGGGGGGSIGGNGAIGVTTRIQYGDISLEVRFSPQARIAQLQDQQITLGDANVLLIDTVDTVPQVVGTRQVDRVIPTAGRIELLLRQSVELLDGASAINCCYPPLISF